MNIFVADFDVGIFTGRVLVHEWGHYRWGLFDEYADPVGDPDNYKEFYYSWITGLWEGVRFVTPRNSTKFMHNTNYNAAGVSTEQVQFKHFQKYQDFGIS